MFSKYNVWQKYLQLFKCRRYFCHTLYMLRDICKDILLIINITSGTRTCLVSCVVNNLRTRLLSLGMGRYIILIMKIWNKQIYKINLFATHVIELLKPFLAFKGHCRDWEWASTEDVYLWCREGHTHNWVDNCVREKIMLLGQLTLKNITNFFFLLNSSSVNPRTFQLPSHSCVCVGERESIRNQKEML